MLEIYAERVAERLVSDAKSGELKSLKSLDWAKVIEFIMQLLEMLAPFFINAPEDKTEYDEWVGQWADALEGGRKARRKLGWTKRIGLAVFERRVRKHYGKEICRELDMDVFLATAFREAVALTPDEFAQLRAEAAVAAENE